MDNNTNNEEKSWFMKDYNRIIVLVAIVIVGITFLFLNDFVFGDNYSSQIDSEKFSHWGSCISGIMATGAFFFAFQTYKEQNRYNAKKDSENIFFKLFETLESHINQLKFTNERDEVISGREVMIELSKRLKQTIDTIHQEELHDDIFSDATEFLDVINSPQNPPPNEEGNRIHERNARFQNEYAHVFYLYFQLVYQIINLTDKTELISENDKKSLMVLFQKLLSPEEIVLVFHYAIYSKNKVSTATEGSNFCLLLDKYQFLKFIDDKKLASKSISIKEEYYPNTFKA